VTADRIEALWLALGEIDAAKAYAAIQALAGDPRQPPRS